MLSRSRFNDLVQRAEERCATQEELAELEPYRARRAVLLASGFGSRMLPITETLPKPLVSVNGRRIIESILDALQAVGVEDVVIVRGYLAKEFDVLLERYPYIKFVDNPLYDSTNNISSALAAVQAYPHAFENAYAFESDIFIKNPALITRYQYESNYLGVPVEATPDWCFDVKDGKIIDLHKGGTDCHHMYGISYWSEQDGRMLARDLPRAFEDEATHQRFWDDVPCVLNRDDFKVAVRPCTFDDVDEIDSFDELCEIDPSYRTWGNDNE